MNLQRPTQTITIAGKTYDTAALQAEDVAFNVSAYAQQLLDFLRDWFSPSDVMRVFSSGSTGAPKQIMVEKERMMQSARLTCEFLGLQQGDKALLCMPLEYIGGKMVVVRALVAGLDLHFVTPCARPLQHIEERFAFSAMVPMQVYDSLLLEHERARLMAIRHLIIGGGSVDAEMALVLQKFPHHVYSTYGMTETLSHIAMRKLNGSSASDRYHLFNSVRLSLASPDNTLIIDAPLVAKERIYTHDVAHIYEDGSFRILGRKDNVINSGGIKIQAEEVESLLKPVIKNGAFAITSAPDPKYGQIVVLAVEQPVEKTAIRDVLSRYEVPKKIIQLAQIPLTETGKICRAELKKFVLTQTSAEQTSHTVDL